MNNTYRKSFCRENVMYGAYGHILLEHLSDSYDYLEKLKNLDKKTNSYNEFSDIKNKIGLNYIEIVVFSIMCVEAFLNDYIASCILDDNYYKNFDMLNILAKLNLIVQFIFKDDSDKSKKCASMLKGLNKKRNNLVHSKSNDGTYWGYHSLEELEENSFKENFEDYFDNTITQDIKSCFRLFDDSKQAIIAVVELAKYFDSQDVDLYALFRIFSFNENDWLNELQCNEKQLKAFEILGFKTNHKGN